MIDAELYRVFFIVACCGNISAAAGKLFVSQPAVSKSIHKLEDLTGCTLFIRGSRGVRLTTEGRILFAYVQDAFGHLENGEQVLQKIRNRQEGMVRIGISTILCRHFFLPFLEDFHKRYPGIRITVVTRPSVETIKLLEQGQIDFAVISIPEDRSGFVYHDLLSIEDIFVAAGGQRQTSRPVAVADLAGYPLMMLEKDNLTRRYVDAWLAGQGVVLQPEIEIGSMEFLIEFAKIGLGIALVIKNFVTEELRQGALVQIPLVPAIPVRQVGIAVPKNLPQSIAAETFIEFLLAAPRQQSGNAR
jgi:DNA-binding transcriptional LysR family regulator